MGWKREMNNNRFIAFLPRDISTPFRGRRRFAVVSFTHRCETLVLCTPTSPPPAPRRRWPRPRRRWSGACGDSLLCGDSLSGACVCGGLVRTDTHRVHPMRRWAGPQYRPHRLRPVRRCKLLHGRSLHPLRSGQQCQDRQCWSHHMQQMRPWHTSQPQSDGVRAVPARECHTRCLTVHGVQWAWREGQR